MFSLIACTLSPSLHVNDDCPELLVLNIGWGVLAWCLGIELHTASKI
jgi:hypothetical protein